MARRRSEVLLAGSTRRDSGGDEKKKSIIRNENTIRSDFRRGPKITRLFRHYTTTSAASMIGQLIPFNGRCKVTTSERNKIRARKRKRIKIRIIIIIIILGPTH